MLDLTVPVRVFDPATPFETHAVNRPAVETWHVLSVITKTTRARLPFTADLGHEDLHVPGGARIRVPATEIGIQVGSLTIERCKVLVVDRGHHELLVGGRALEQLFAVGWAPDSDTRVGNPAKDDPESLAIELYPVAGTASLAQFEAAIRNQRRLHNVALVAAGEINPSGSELGQLIDYDIGLSDNLRLKLTWLDTGSIWMTLRSGSVKALRYLADFFDASASARLAQQVSDAHVAEDQAHISKTVRDDVAQRIAEEQQRLRAENIGGTYEAWRTEMRDRLDFADELIGRLADIETQQRLTAARDEAITELVETQLLPIVRNVPRAPLDDDVLRLPPPGGS